MAVNIDTAVRLVKQAILQDSKKNYEEAGRCYREALYIFHHLRRTPHTGHRVRNFLDTKVVQYEERLRAIDAYLLAQNDWTKFFKDIEPGGGENECRSSSTSSRSSETRQLYRNPLLVSALDSLRRGRKADERYEYRTALECYSNGLKAMQAIINRGILTPRQEAAARSKCLLYHDRAEAIRTALEGGGRLYSSGRRGSGESNLSLNSASDSPVPDTEAEHLMQMEEVHSYSSRLGSASSLHQEEEGEGEQDQLNRTHAILHASLPHLAAIPPRGHHCTPHHQSLHSLLYTGNGCNRAAHQLVTPRPGASPPRATPPLVCLDTELNISSLSLGRPHENEEEEEEVVSADTLEVELLQLAGSCEDIKCGEYEESDSGYSDPSPEAQLIKSAEEDANSSSINNNTMMADRKSMFSDLSDDDEEDEVDTTTVDDDDDEPRLQQPYQHQQHDIFPTVIIKNQEQQQMPLQRQRSSSSPTFGRQYGRQRSVFQTPGKDILTSVVSRDDLAVIGQDSVDVTTTTGMPFKDGSRQRLASSGAGVRPAIYDETYRRRLPPDDAVPSRSTAKRGEEKPEKNGCFYVMTALDFCWCL